jgi:hypothetical protein
VRAVKLLDYCGAGARLNLDRGLALDPRRWAWMPKVDGCYARVSTDRRGRVFSVLSRAGAPLREAFALIGILAGAPDSVLHGELEAHTEAGNRAAARGWRNVWLFDVTRIAGRDVSRARFADRYAELHRMQAELELAGRSNPWTVDDQGDAHDQRNGRYCMPAPRDVRRFPIVELRRGGAGAESLWVEHVERAGGEGLVAVGLDAPAGARNAKRKIKVTDTLDATVVVADARALVVEYAGHAFAVACSGAVYATGDVVEIAHDGWYESSVTPRFPRVVRARADIVA